NPGGELRRGVVPAAALPGRCHHVRRPCRVGEPRPGAKPGPADRPAQTGRGARAAAWQPDSCGLGEPHGSGRVGLALPVGPLYQNGLSYEQEIKLTAGKTLKLSVLLDVNAVELAPIVVEAKSIRAERSLAGFYDRRKWGFGRFYTRQDLERRRGLPLESLLRESGVSVGCRTGYCLPLGWTGGRACVMSLYLDAGRMAG